MKLDFVVRGYTTGKTEPMTKAETKIKTAAPSTSSSHGAGASSNSITVNVSGIEIQNILDVLPHLEVPFVRKLLTRYENAESAIAAVLEGNLPPDLDESIQIDSPKIEQKNEAVNQCTDMMEKHNLAVDDREILNIKIKSQVVRPKAEKRFLDDKSAIKEFHARNIEHGYVDMADEYDDEYDDSYDAVVESESRAMTKILKKTGAINELVDEVEDSDESESDDEDTQPSQHREKNRDFCENPEVARERWARNREAKYGNRPPARPTGYVLNWKC